MTDSNVITEQAREIPVIDQVDVLVVGGGPAGWPAAIAAARSGARTMLLERYGFLGGVGTQSNVCILFGYTAVESDEQIVAGIAEEIFHQLEKLNGILSARQAGKVLSNDPASKRRPYFVPEAMKYAAENLVLDAGVILRYHSLVCGVHIADKRIDAVFVESKSGRAAIKAKFFIDASGDGDLAYWAGCPTASGRDFDGRNNACSSVFFMSGYEPLTQEQSDKIRTALAAEVDAGRLQIRSISPGMFTRYMPKMPRITPVHISRYPGDMTDVEQLTNAEITNRRDNWKFIQFLKNQFPELFKDACMVNNATQVGIRETRRILGEYVLTTDDVITGRKFDDSIAHASWHIDIHCPMGYTSSKSTMNICDEDCVIPLPCEFRDAGEHKKIPGKHTNQPRHSWPPVGDWYDIPYRSLLPKGIDNLLVAGRCASGTFEAQASFRVMATCMAMGQAAGTAAAISANHNTSCAQLSVPCLRKQLTADGAIV